METPPFICISSAIVSESTAASFSRLSLGLMPEDIDGKISIIVQLSQFIEYFCLFENLYCDPDKKDAALPIGVRDIFDHPSLASVDRRFLDANVDDVEVDDYDKFIAMHYGPDFRETLINAFLDGLGRTAGYDQQSRKFEAIFAFDHGLATALAVDSSRDSLRKIILGCPFSRSIVRLGLIEEKPPVDPFIFTDNSRWQNRVGSIYLPTINEYLIHFQEDEDSELSLDAGRAIRRAYAQLVKHMSEASNFEDEFIVAPSFSLPPITTAVLHDASVAGISNAEDLCDHIVRWREKFVSLRNILNELNDLRKERPKGYRNKLAKLKLRVERAIEALTGKQGINLSTKIDMINLDNLSDLDVNVDDFRSGNITKFGIDKLYRFYDLRFIRPLPEVKRKAMAIENEEKLICSVFQISEQDWAAKRDGFRLQMAEVSDELSRIFGA